METERFDGIPEDAMPFTIDITCLIESIPDERFLMCVHKGCVSAAAGEDLYPCADCEAPICDGCLDENPRPDCPVMDSPDDWDFKPCGVAR